MGHAILNRTGHFLWCDFTTQKLFELIKGEQWKELNFFSLLIPFSKYSLRRKISIFSQNSETILEHGTHSINFTYVIYSKKNRDKYAKYLVGKMKGRNVPEQTEETKNKQLYYKYL